jgi:O-methyltransferase domain
MIGGFRLSRMISVVARLGVADHLRDGPKTRRELADLTHAHEESLYRVMRTLSSVGIFEEDGDGRFRLTPLADPLRSDAPRSLRLTAMAAGEEWIWRPWGALLHTVTTGETAFDHLYGTNTWQWFAGQPEAARLFDGFMDEVTASDAHAIVEAFDFSSARTIVDVAGGRGVLLAEILKRTPQARGILHNLADVIESARQLIDPSIAERIDFAPGSFFDDVPGGADLYILKNILHDWDNNGARAILGRCRRAMPPRAKLLIVEHMVRGSNQPCPGAIQDVHMMVRTGGRNRTEDEFHELLAAEHFDLLRLIPTRGGPDLIEASQH